MTTMARTLAWIALVGLWLGLAGACLMLLSLFLHSFARGQAGGRWRALLGLAGAAALLPAAWLAFRAPLFFLLVGWVLVCALRLLRAPTARRD